MNSIKGYISIREASYKWGVSERRVNQYCVQGRIPGLSCFGRSWDIPEDAEKPHPSLIAVYLGLIRMALQIPLPSFIDGAIDGLGGCTSPMAMALVGAILADSKLSTVFSLRAFYLVAVRQIALPLLCLLGLYLLKAETLVMGVSVTLSAMPIGSTTAILAQKYGADASFASKCVFVSTLTSLITVPLITLLL